MASVNIGRAEEAASIPTEPSPPVPGTAVFLWIPKCAGTSIWDTLLTTGSGQMLHGYMGGGAYYKPQYYKGGIDGFQPDVAYTTFLHTDIRVILDISNRLTLDWVHTRFVFAFVRNTWDRLVSLWHHLFRRHESIANSRGKVFKTFIENCVADDRESIGAKDVNGLSMASPQIDWLRLYGEWLPDFVGRYENLRQDWQRVCQELGISAELQHKNKTENRKPYREYYDDRLRRLVAVAYEEEIDMFKFTF